jgi:TrmH family RNA methyltransferase
MPLSHVRVVLVNPLYGGNVGSVCRAMANMGLSDLVLVAPGALDREETRMMACAAWDLFERRREVPSLAEAVADCGMVVGTTARAGLYRAHAQSPRELAPQILAAAETGRVALVFGRESWGLTNEEIALCTRIAQIPASADYPSLNLSHAVILFAGELFLAAGLYVPPAEKSPVAPAALRERMFAMWEEVLLEIGFMEREKALHMMLGVRRIFSRGPLSEDDCRILMGIARQMRWKARQGAGAPAPPPDEAG